MACEGIRGRAGTVHNRDLQQILLGRLLPEVFSNRRHYTDPQETNVGSYEYLKLPANLELVVPLQASGACGENPTSGSPGEKRSSA